MRENLCVCARACIHDACLHALHSYVCERVNVFNRWMCRFEVAESPGMQLWLLHALLSELLQTFFGVGKTKTYRGSGICDARLSSRIGDVDGGASSRIDNLQNYCLGTRYGARSRSWLCRRLSLTHSFAIDMVSKSFLSTISSRFGDVLTLTIYLQIFCEFKTHFFSGKKADLFDRKRQWRGMACSCAVVHRLSKAVSIFFFKPMLSRKSSISKTLMQQRRRGHACAVLPVWCAGHIIVKSVRQVPTLT